MGLTSDPAALLVDDLRGEERLQELAVVAVDIANRHDALDFAPGVLADLLLLGLRDRSAAGEKDQEDDGARES